MKISVLLHSLDHNHSL